MLVKRAKERAGMPIGGVEVVLAMPSFFNIYFLDSFLNLFFFFGNHQ